MTFDLAPGNILQRMHFRRRLRALQAKIDHPVNFIEFGMGSGWLSEIALSEGGYGIGFDLNSESCAASRRRNAAAIDDGRYLVCNTSFDPQQELPNRPIHLVFSCMVLEHLSEQQIDEVVAAARSACVPHGGVFAAFVPAEMRYWGIEDEVAGHFRRYNRELLVKLGREREMTLTYCTGLTFPVSNILRALSNRLVMREERERLHLSMQERTVKSGYREVPFKTRFPGWTRLILNEWALWPFDALQRFFGGLDRSMVLYAEWKL